MPVVSCPLGPGQTPCEPYSRFCSTDGWAHWKGERPGAEQGRVLWTYSTQMSCLIHVAVFCKTRQPSVVSGSWLRRSVWPLDWGWYPEVPRREQKAFKNLKANCGPRSNTTSFWKPCKRNKCSNITFAVSLSWRQLGKRDKVNHFQKNSPPLDGFVTFWGGQCRDEVQGDVRAGEMGNQKRTKEPCRRVTRDLIPGTHQTGGQLLTHLLLHGRPPEPLFDDKACSLYTSMAGQEGGVSPVDGERQE